MVTVDQYRRIALGLAGAVEREHMGHPDFRAPGWDGRIFATIHDTHETGSLMLTPEQQQRFLREAADAFFPAPGAWGRNGSTSVRFASVDEELLGEAMTMAWQNVMAKGAKGAKAARAPARRSSGKPTPKAVKKKAVKKRAVKKRAVERTRTRRK